MRKQRSVFRPLLFPLALLIFALAPAVAGASTLTFLRIQALNPSEGALTGGPATAYPSNIVVGGFKGTVTRASVSILDLDSSSPDDIDMVLSGPNGKNVMLMSDACGEYPNRLESDDWTFEDAAPTFLSDNGPCAIFQQTSFKPSNYLGSAPEPDDLSPNGGPPPPYLNALSFFNGISPNGTWSLFVRDDNPIGYNGFDINAWALTLDVAPPPSETKPKITGRRAAALGRCKTLKTSQARKRCRNRAMKLPR